jgi:hypothetical protein
MSVSAKKSNSWRTVQFFLESENAGVCEVESDRAGNFRCDCSVFSKGGKSCRHVRLVRKRSEENNGPYPLQVSVKASAKEVEDAQNDPEKFRQFVIKYGRIEVL